jgi:hypothetical protein
VQKKKDLLTKKGEKVLKGKNIYERTNINKGEKGPW